MGHSCMFSLIFLFNKSGKFPLKISMDPRPCFCFPRLLWFLNGDCLTSGTYNSGSNGETSILSLSLWPQGAHLYLTFACDRSERAVSRPGIREGPLAWSELLQSGCREGLGRSGRLILNNQTECVEDVLQPRPSAHLLTPVCCDSHSQDTGSWGCDITRASTRQRALRTDMPTGLPYCPSIL